MRTIVPILWYKCVDTSLVQLSQREAFVYEMTLMPISLEVSLDLKSY